jgi:formylglycine-generating enzyme required for sulfatase activity
VPKQWLLNALSETKTQRRFALLDACRERFKQGERGGGAAAMSPSFHEALAKAQGTVVLAATTTGGFAYDDPARQNGVFSAAILDGLHGGASKTEERYVTAGTLADYVDRQVRAWVSEKRPSSVPSPGITRTIEGAGASLPLAANESITPPGTLWTEPVTGMEFVWIPRGCFDMGTDDGEPDERPVHRVCVSGFWMGRQEVTQGQWQAVMYENPSGFRRGLNHPVEQVSWDDVQRFIKKLNARGRDGFRLPSEAEWEYACRAGQAGPYCGGDDPDPLAWFSQNSESTPHPVGRKQANAWGLQDMSGNVWEWVQDCYHDSYQDAPDDGSAREEAECPWRVFRGGAWANYQRALRAASRLRHKPSLSSDDLGFRLARRPW